MKRKDFFKGFILENQTSDKIQRYLFSNQNKLYDYQEWVLSGNYLFVVGQYGSSIYHFNEPADLRVIATYDLDYFASKLVSSEVPKYVFNGGKALETLIELTCDCIRKNINAERFVVFKCFKASDNEWDKMTVEEKLSASDAVIVALLGLDFTVYDAKSLLKKQSGSIETIGVFMAEHPDIYGVDSHKYLGSFKVHSPTIVQHYDAILKSQNRSYDI